MLKKWRCGVWEHPLCRLLALILISALKPLSASFLKSVGETLSKYKLDHVIQLLEVFQWALTNC